MAASPRDPHFESVKTRNLVVGLLLDAIGMLSFSIPFIGEFGDVIWAPVSGLLMTVLYKGRDAKTAAVISVAEELFPFTDIIPTFTAMWIWTYIIRRKSLPLPKNEAQSDAR